MLRSGAACWAIADGKLIYNLLDAHVVAVDLKTGKELWRAYSTGSDKDVKIGARFKPLYPQYQGKDLGLKSWPPGASPKGAGAVWGFISYDPKLNLVYYGTSNPSPRVPSQRPGDNLWTSSVFARDATTGEAVWAYQFTPHDQWDYDGVNEMMLLDLPINGKMRHTIVHFDRNTYAYVLDRETGEVLKADTFAGLTPKDHSTGGKVRLGTITRAGDEGLRRVLVVGATSLLRQVRAGHGRDRGALSA